MAYSHHKIIAGLPVMSEAERCFNPLVPWEKWGQSNHMDHLTVEEWTSLAIGSLGVGTVGTIASVIHNVPYAYQHLYWGWGLPAVAVAILWVGRSGIPMLQDKINEWNRSSNRQSFQLIYPRLHDIHSSHRQELTAREKKDFAYILRHTSSSLRIKMLEALAVSYPLTVFIEIISGIIPAKHFRGTSSQEEVCEDVAKVFIDMSLEDRLEGLVQLFKRNKQMCDDVNHNMDKLLGIKKTKTSG